MRRTHLAADVSGVHLVHYISKRRKLVLSVIAVNTIVYGDESDVMVGEEGVGVVADLEIVSAEARHILHDHGGDIAHLDVLEYLLKAGAVEVSAGVAVVHIEAGVAEAVLLGVLGQELLLRRNLSRGYFAKNCKLLINECEPMPITKLWA